MLVRRLVFKTSGGRLQASPVGSIPMHSRHFFPFGGSVHPAREALSSMESGCGVRSRALPLPWNQA